MRKEVDIYIGTYFEEIKIGGYGIILEYNGKIEELSMSVNPTTKYRIKLLAVVVALNTLTEPCEVTIYIDSEYVINGIRKKNWAYSWQERGWRRSIRSGGKKAKNSDLWRELMQLVEKHNVDFVWIRSHNGYEYGYEYNERCNKLAIEAVKRNEINSFFDHLFL